MDLAYAIELGNNVVPRPNIPPDVWEKLEAWEPVVASYFRKDGKVNWVIAAILTKNHQWIEQSEPPERFRYSPWFKIYNNSSSEPPERFRYNLQFKTCNNSSDVIIIDADNIARVVGDYDIILKLVQKKRLELTYQLLFAPNYEIAKTLLQYCSEKIERISAPKSYWSREEQKKLMNKIRTQYELSRGDVWTWLNRLDNYMVFGYLLNLRSTYCSQPRFQAIEKKGEQYMCLLFLRKLQHIESWNGLMEHLIRKIYWYI